METNSFKNMQNSIGNSESEYSENTDSSAQVGSLAEARLTFVTMTGVVVPWTGVLSQFEECHFKLVAKGGAQYFIDADKHWHKVLSRHRWQEVKVKGLLNVSKLKIIPQKIYSHDSNGDRESAAELPVLVHKQPKKSHQPTEIPIRLANDGPRDESFGSILRRKIMETVNAGSDRVELKGLILPRNVGGAPTDSNYKFVTETDEYLLSLKPALMPIAKTLEWSEVVITGFVNEANDTIRPEKIILVKSADIPFLGDWRDNPLAEAIDVLKNLSLC